MQSCQDLIGEEVGWLTAVGQQLQPLDWFALLLPATLLGRELRQFRPSGTGRLTYLLSVSAAYGLLLWSVHQSESALALALGTAVSVFHATEYLAIVTWAAKRKRHPQGVLGYLVPRWTFTLIVFIAVLTLSAALIDTWFASLWLVLNLVASFMHYTYDGIIWKARKAAAPPAGVPAR
jgi:hypothetical protein